NYEWQEHQCRVETIFDTIHSFNFFYIPFFHSLPVSGLNERDYDGAELFKSVLSPSNFNERKTKDSKRDPKRIPKRALNLANGNQYESNGEKRKNCENGPSCGVFHR